MTIVSAEQEKQRLDDRLEAISAALRSSPIASEACQAAADQVSALDASNPVQVEDALLAIEQQVVNEVAAVAPPELVASLKAEAEEEWEFRKGLLAYYKLLPQPQNGERKGVVRQKVIPYGDRQRMKG
jgi:hypothetical protein